MSTHRIIINPGSPPQVECVTPDKCTGWVDCLEDHGDYEPDDDGDVYAGGVEYNDGDTAMIHGVIHTLRWSYDWTVPYDGCVIAANMGGIDLVDEIDRFRPGVWEVETEWDDGMLDDDWHLALVREITDIPAKETP